MYQCVNGMFRESTMNSTIRGTKKLPATGVDTGYRHGYGYECN